MKQRMFAVMLLVLAGFNLGARVELEEKLRWAHTQYSKYQDTLSQDGKLVAEAYITLVEKRLSGGDKEIIEAYDRLYELASAEYEKNRQIQSTLFRLFHFDFSGIPLVIAQICRDSKSLSAEEKAAIIEKQRERSHDNRITIIRIDELKRSASYPKAIEYTLTEIQKGNKAMWYKLALLRIEYQYSLIAKAIKEKGTGDWQPHLIPFDQLHEALHEAKINLERDPFTAEEYSKVFLPSFEQLEAYEEAIDFYDYALSKLRETQPEGSKLLNDMAQHLDRFKKKVQEKVQ